MPKKLPDPYAHPGPDHFAVTQLDRDLTKLALYYEAVRVRTLGAIDAVSVPSNDATRDRIAAALRELSTARQELDVALRITAEFASTERHLTQRETARAINGTYPDETAAPINNIGHTTVGAWLRNPLSVEEAPLPPDSITP